MPLYRLLEGYSFAPHEVPVLVSAFEQSLRRLQLDKRRDDPATEMVARRIIAFVLQGERDPQRLCDRTVDFDS
jgi:hypothetical protein